MKLLYFPLLFLSLLFLACIPDKQSKKTVTSKNKSEEKKNLPFDSDSKPSTFLLLYVITNIRESFLFPKKLETDKILITIYIGVALLAYVLILKRVKNGNLLKAEN